MTYEENQRRSNHPRVRELKEKIRTKDSGKYYLFVSYKSDDWELVLTEIIYRLTNQYGLNVYYDGSFDHHNDSWIKQMPDNMDSPFCVGVLAFLDDKYATSYATLMELMHSQTFNADTTDSGGLPIIPVNLDNLHKISGIEGSEDTGLGVVTFTDGSQNINAEAERDRFERDYEEICELSFIKREFKVYDKGGVFTKRHCSTMVRELLASKGYNTNMYNKPDFYENILNTIKNTCGEIVFSKVSPAKYPVEKTEPVVMVSAKAPVFNAEPAAAAVESEAPIPAAVTGSVNGDIFGAPNNGVTVKPVFNTEPAAAVVENNDPIPAAAVTGSVNGDIFGVPNNGAPAEPAFNTEPAAAVVESIDPIPAAEEKSVNGKKPLPEKKGYRGEKRKGKPNGKGRMVYPDRKIYDGEWKDGQKHGHGIITYPDGRVYDGEWKFDCYHDHGKLTYPDGRVYDGEWREGLLSGLGKMTYPDGKIYDGEWLEGWYHGHGVMTYPDGRVYDGEWRNGAANGLGTMTYPDGKVYNGEWKGGKKNGYGRTTCPDGTIFEGNWKNDKFHGHGKMIRNDGTVKVGTWKADNFIG